MNKVPLGFYESVIMYFFIDSSSVCRSLSGVVGAVSTAIWEEKFFSTAIIEEGQLTSTLAYSCNITDAQGLPIQVVKDRRRYKVFTSVFICARAGDYSTDPVAIERTRKHIGDGNVVLTLTTSNLSKEIRDFIGSIPVSILRVQTEITERIQETLWSLAERKILNRFIFNVDVLLNSANTKLILEVLKQDSFKKFEFPNNSFWFMNSLLMDWDQNWEKMVGKQLWFRNNFANLIGFRRCTDDEENDLLVYDRLACRRRGNKPIAYVTSNQKGGKMFHLVYNENCDFKNIILIT